jgi:hypothetical protein
MAQYFNNIQRCRVFEVSYIHPTNRRNGRVRIKDLRWNETKIIPYDHSIGNMDEQALNFLNGIDIHIINIGFGKDKTYFSTYNFDVRIRKSK